MWIPQDMGSIVSAGCSTRGGRDYIDLLANHRSDPFPSDHKILEHVDFGWHYYTAYLLKIFASNVGLAHIHRKLRFPWKYNCKNEPQISTVYGGGYLTKGLISYIPTLNNLG